MPESKPLPLTSRQKLLSLAEFLLGTFFVIGHNVFRIVPNEVYFLLGLFWLSFGLRERGYKFPGLTRPNSWLMTIGMAVAAVIVLQGGSSFVVEPIAHHFWPEPERVSDALRLAPNWKDILGDLALVWTFAAFGEELGYRGYLLNRAADLGDRSRAAFIVAMFLVAVLFGLGHWYKGPAGVLDSTYSGLVLGGVYLLSGRNLWAPILAHGLSDTFAVIVVSMGWVK